MSCPKNCNEPRWYDWKKDYELVHSQKADFTEKEKRVFPITLDQCSCSLRSQLKGDKTFQEMCKKNDVMELLKLIQSFCCKHDQNNDKYYAVFNSLWALFINFQKNDQSNDDYLKEFQGQMALLENYDVNVVDLLPCLMKDSLNELSNTTMELATEKKIIEAKENMLKRGSVTLLLIRADHARYGVMKNQMQQNMVMGTNNYLKSVYETMNILNIFAKTSKAGNWKKPFQKYENNSKAAFAQKALSNVMYYHCGEKGHFARTWPSKKSSNKAHVHTQIANEVDDEEEEEFGYIIIKIILAIHWKLAYWLRVRVALIFSIIKSIWPRFTKSRNLLSCTVMPDMFMLVKRDGLAKLKCGTTPKILPIFCL